MNIGNFGEKIAREYILTKNYDILDLNYLTKMGEIDIIAKDKDIIVFIEVKTRKNAKYGYAYESVNWNKQRKIKNTSTVYLLRNNLNNVQIRYDIIEIYTDNKKINHIENAF